MTRPIRRHLGVAVLLVVVLGLAACGGDEPPAVEDTSEVPLVPTETSEDASPTLSPTPATDEDILRALAQEVAEQQRPGEFVGVGDITVFDDPEGCASGEAAFVSVELTGEPAQGDILFCRIDGEPGWELSQGILYGE